VEDLKEELRAMYIASGMKGVHTVFLITLKLFAQNSWFTLVALLTSGWIPDLFPKEDRTIFLDLSLMMQELKEYQTTPNQGYITLCQD